MRSQGFKTIYAYPFVFFPFFCRFFSLVFGGFSKQDEARISEILDIGTYTFALFVIIIMFLMVWRASKVLKINSKYNAYFLTVSTFCMLLVIGTYELIA